VKTFNLIVEGFFLKQIFSVEYTIFRNY